MKHFLKKKVAPQLLKKRVSDNLSNLFLTFMTSALQEKKNRVQFSFGNDAVTIAL